tara:strand:- start:1703 stop:2731 length:1029 start_codon:yes stop_codon:yes gene_type:complete
MIVNRSVEDIKNDTKLKNSFLNVQINKLNINCNVYKGNFYLDSFNYFLINEDNQSFENLFKRDIYQDNKHFFTEKFFENFNKNLDKFKEFKNIFVLGSSAANNYYSNLLQFLPRIFFLKENNIKIAIHRNSSTKFREFIKLILISKKIDFSFVYLDDGFYKFTNSEIPQFLSLSKSIQILKNLIQPKKSKFEDKKIYVTREDSSYRKIVNEADILPILRSRGYKVINPQLYNIDEQVRIFSQADKIISPHGSNLTNIIFCKPGTEIYEIGPEFNSDYEKFFENRYQYLAKVNGLKYTRFLADTVPVANQSSYAKQFINNRILENSNYYKNLIVKISDLQNLD